MNRPVSRREFLIAGSIFSWIPFLRPKHISLAGARFRIVYNGRSKRRYVLIHGDEETARSVLARHMRTHEGIAYVIENHTRHITVAGGEVDPNRIFSPAGAKANLEMLNPGWQPDQVTEAMALLDRDREKLVRALTPPKGGLLVSLHNNTEGYSVINEEPISDNTSIREPDRPDGFYLCTDPADFGILAQSPYNVVLQQKAPNDDDGSLSRLCAARGVRYVNLEVRLGNEARQLEMLQWLEWHLPEEPGKKSRAETYMS